MKLFSRFKKFLYTTYHRRELDDIQRDYSNIFYGKVLDIGGTNRGSFKKPINKTNSWIVADLTMYKGVDMVLDITNMDRISDESIDIVRAIEVFEHVKDPLLALDESCRVLKKGGSLVLSAPFMYPIHAAPEDYQRWTESKWKKELRCRGFDLECVHALGSIYTIIGDILKKISKNSNILVKYFLYLIFLIWEGVYILDRKKLLPNFLNFSSYVDGYFIIAKKQ